jgi:hypothetical protein
MRVIWTSVLALMLLVGGLVAPRPAGAVEKWQIPYYRDSFTRKQNVLKNGRLYRTYQVNADANAVVVGAGVGIGVGRTIVDGRNHFRLVLTGKVRAGIGAGATVGVDRAHGSWSWKENTIPLGDQRLSGGLTLLGGFERTDQTQKSPRAVTSHGLTLGFDAHYMREGRFNLSIPIPFLSTKSRSQKLVEHGLRLVDEADRAAKQGRDAEATQKVQQMEAVDKELQRQLYK